MKIYNFNQRTEDWDLIRLGKFTGSNYHTFLKGTPQTKEKELYKKASEIITKTKSDSDNFSNTHLKRGIELEGEAMSIYELINNVKVDIVGFIELSSHIGCSPDGLIDKDGMIEIKCKDNHTFLKYKIDGKIEPNYYTQIQFNLFVSKRDWCDFIVYNPNFSDSLIVKRVLKDNQYIKQIKKSLVENIKTIKKIIKISYSGKK